MSYQGAHIPCVENCSYPLRFGNTVRPLIDGAPAFRRICEAVEQARYSVWVTMAFIELEFQMPDGRGSFFDVLDRAKERDIDVRVIFWRSPEAALEPNSSHFHGSPEHRGFLLSRGCQILARWDRMAKAWCHHQKSWLIDAGRDTEIDFVGGINLNKNSMVEPGHDQHENGSTHDIYVEIRGPAATDVHHNFVQRWNESSERKLPNGLWPVNEHNGDLPFPGILTPVVGEIPAQITRTVRRETYTDSTPSPGAESFPIVRGEQSRLELYNKIFESARETIYIEDQVIGSPSMLEKIVRALQRGIEIIYVLPGKANRDLILAHENPLARPFFDQIKSLGSFSNFTMVALASNRGKNKYLDIYVHSKIALVDGVWATIGSCNIADRSFYSDTEMNVSFWDGKTARDFRNSLFDEHLGADVSHMDDLEAFKYFGASHICVAAPYILWS